MSNPNGPRPSVSWNVTGQVPQVGRVANGPFVQGVLITFTLGDGHTGQLFVAQPDYTPAKVQELLAAKVRDMADIASLGGTV